MCVNCDIYMDYGIDYGWVLKDLSADIIESLEDGFKWQVSSMYVDSKSWV